MIFFHEISINFQFLDVCLYWFRKFSFFAKFYNCMSTRDPIEYSIRSEYTADFIQNAAKSFDCVDLRVEA